MCVRCGEDIRHDGESVCVVVFCGDGIRLVESL